jgi:polyhydroxyalkanoate synthesis regulator phasin
MTLNHLQQQLADIAAQGTQPFAGFAQQINDLVVQAQAGEMTAAETTEILADAQRQLSILEDMSELRLKEQLNIILTGLITLAAAV